MPAKKKKIKKTVSHPLYGEIPLTEIKMRRFDGIEYTAEIFDPDFTPDLPPGAIRGNVDLQNFCSWCHPPKYFYIDIPCQCIQCDELFIFTAKEQKFWYETLKFNFHSKAIRCPSCRKQKRTVKLFEKQRSSLMEAHKRYPKDTVVMIALAESICECYQMGLGGNLDFVISLSRKALKKNPSLFESLYWEAFANHLKKREKAKVLLEKFLTIAKPIPKYKNLCKKATHLLNLELYNYE